MIYAIVDIGGCQMWVEPGKFYDVNYISSNPGDIIYLNRVLFLSKSNTYQVGLPCLSDASIKVRVLRHLRGSKLTIFKVKPKKNMRKKQGHRQKLTRFFVEEIVL